MCIVGSMVSVVGSWLCIEASIVCGGLKMGSGCGIRSEMCMCMRCRVWVQD